MIDYLIVGAGLFGATFARLSTIENKSCVVIDKRNHIAGNCYTEDVEGVMVHKYGAHIFHTSNKMIWNFVNKYSAFNNFINSPVANYKGRLYNLPFNMNTFSQIWHDVKTPADAMAKIESQKLKINSPKNLEEQALSLVGSDIYELLIKGYTEKQWGKKCSELPAEIIKRLPLRFIFDNNYFNDKYQGIPEQGYTKLIENMLGDIPVHLNTEFKDCDIAAKKVIYTGAIDELFEYKLGALEYRSLRFETETIDTDNLQGNAVINYTEAEIPFTRIIEHRHFDKNCNSSKTVVTKEYPAEWEIGKETYYPINDDKNNSLYEKYKALAENVISENGIVNEKNKAPLGDVGGRLGGYRYFDMDKTIEAAMALYENNRTKI